MTSPPRSDRTMACSGVVSRWVHGFVGWRVAGGQDESDGTTCVFAVGFASFSAAPGIMPGAAQIAITRLPATSEGTTRLRRNQ